MDKPNESFCVSVLSETLTMSVYWLGSNSTSLSMQSSTWSDSESESVSESVSSGMQA